jgi:hypothetical protein
VAFGAEQVVNSGEGPDRSADPLRPGQRLDQLSKYRALLLPNTPQFVLSRWQSGWPTEFERDLL